MRFVLMLAAASVALSGCPLLEELTRPKLERVEPQAGPPGTEVELRGQLLRNPFIDDVATVWFGDTPIRVRPECEIANGTPDLSQGCITLWNNATIRFITPTNDTLPGERIIRVETEGGFSEPLTFNVLPGDAGAEARFDDFVGAVILEGDDKIALFRMHKEGDLEHPELSLRDWDASGRRVTSVTYRRPGYDTTAWDLKLDNIGNLFYTVSALPTDGGDGSHQLVHLGGNYTVPITTYELGFDPVRLGMSAQWVGTDDSKLAAISHGGAALQVFEGSDFEPLEPMYLAALGADALPQAVHVQGRRRVYVAGRTPSEGRAWLARVNLDDASLHIFDEVELGDVDPVDVTLFIHTITVGVGEGVTEAAIADLYVAFNADDTGGILRHRTTVTETTSTAVSRLWLPPGYTIGSMALDNKTTLGGVAVPRLWLSIDDVNPERDDDFVLGLRISGEFFPEADSDYTAWAAAVSNAADPGTDPVTTTVVAPFTELRSDCEGCPPLVRDPLGVSVLPSDAGATFVLVVSRSSNSIVVVRTDVTTTAGLLYDEYSLPGTVPTRVSCYLSEGS